MRRVSILIAFILLTSSLVAQNGKHPYPIIFLHGLVGGDDTWTTTVNYLGGSEKVYDICLNHDGSNSTANLTTDIDYVGWRDGNNNPSSNRLYVVNLDSDRFSEAGHESHDLSNQAAVYKQGLALKTVIQAVLSIENAEKVILIGHSMGGLEIREYLQRGYDGSNTGSNWVNQSEDDGHKIAKVITIGTPHLGSNHTGAQIPNPSTDESSDAVRDLRYNHLIVATTYPGPLLFSGSENTNIPNSYYNKDVNCNSFTTDNITGISSGTTFNATMPLPTNIPYCWIASDAMGGGSGDGLVELERQWLHSGTSPTPANITDTLMSQELHLAEPNDYHSIIRGMDEPADESFAFVINEETEISGYITYRTNKNSADTDLFKITLTQNGIYYFTLSGSNSGIETFTIYNGVGTLGTISGTGTITINDIAANTTYYAKIEGTATSTTWKNPYELIVSQTVLPVELTSFTAHFDKLNDQCVELNWRTATEVDNYGFEVQRLQDEKIEKLQDWEMLGFVEGHGNSNSPKDYSFVDANPLNGTNQYRLKQIDTDGSFEYSEILEVELDLPTKFELSQNYPNPFNPTTTIKYSIPVETRRGVLPQATSVQLKIYNLLGQEVATLVNKKQTPGRYEVKFDASNLTSGVYIYRLVSEGFVNSKKFILLK
ncbi:MAG: T9SS type A sorting domain-containing protein [Melioribacteraceae bacterium]|nr:T9SS type A sorting domain-containing protein [Melioribacteraceae bacterium]